VIAAADGRSVARRTLQAQPRDRATSPAQRLRPADHLHPGEGA